MPVEEIVSGKKYVVCEWVAGDSRPVSEFLSSPGVKDARRLRYIIDRFANEGPFSSEASKPLGGDLFEFRGPYGGRIIYFYDAGRIVICAHALVKKQDRIPRRDLEKAQVVMAAYRAERQRRKK